MDKIKRAFIVIDFIQTGSGQKQQYNVAVLPDRSYEWHNGELLRNGESATNGGDVIELTKQQLADVLATHRWKGHMVYTDSSYLKQSGLWNSMKESAVNYLETAVDFLKEAYWDNEKNVRRNNPSTKLKPNQRQMLTAKLVRAGMDGNRYFGRVIDAVNQAEDILRQYGINFVSSPDSYRFKPDDGRITIELERQPTDDYHNITPLEHMLVMTWHKMQVSGDYEIIAYIS